MTGSLLHLHNRARSPKPDVPVTVAFSAVGPCGHEVIWRATMPHNPVPDECAKPACSSAQTDTMGAPGTVLVTPRPPTTCPLAREDR